MHRRQFLSLALLLGAARAKGRAPDEGSGEFETIDLVVEGDRRLARRALVLVPRRPPPKRLPMLVLLHGLGETGNEIAGIHAWRDRYGLSQAWERLAKPPVAPILPKTRYLAPDHAKTLNDALAVTPFEPPVVVCPVTPNPRMHPSATRALDEYGSWITDTLVPAVGSRVTAADTTRVGLDGCSLGGYVALEVFLRHAARFSSIGTVQAAYGKHRVPGYVKDVAERLEEHRVPVHVETSTHDPYREANVAFARGLEKRGFDVDVAVLPGPHNQPWLREAGTLEMLYWHARRLRDRRP